MSGLDWLGMFAGTLTTMAFVPQALLIWRKRRADGVSLGMYIVFTVGVAAWLLYGITLGALPVIVFNAITLALALFILGMKIRYG